MGVITYKCPNCGGGLTFNAEKQKYKCEYCLSEFSQEELDGIAAWIPYAQEFVSSIQPVAVYEYISE